MVENFLSKEKDLVMAKKVITTGSLSYPLIKIVVVSNKYLDTNVRYETCEHVFKFYT